MSFQRNYGYFRPYHFNSPYGSGNSAYGDITADLVLGSLLFNSLNQRQYSGDYLHQNRVVVPASPKLYARPVLSKVSIPGRIGIDSRPKRYLLRDPADRCFYITHTNLGDELHIEINPENCDH
ncbi:MAG: hypothetical protein OXE78_09795 [Gammaproteobacteria bacterium]|nr:hypothetical protein [Gammaproteobacteria bacterium]MCY4357917.1 hypothetical protein [Gammaproteobacteria bacterium]